MKNADVMYPDIRVTLRLNGPEGNAFVIVGTVIAAMRAHGIAQDVIDAYVKEATSSHYGHLLQTTRKYVRLRS